MRKLYFFITFWMTFHVQASYAADLTPTSDREKEFQEVAEQMLKGGPMELKALEIRTKIYEPQIIYVLDRTKVEIEVEEERTTFSNRIEEPILNNEF